MNYFYRTANIRGSQKSLPDQHCLRIGGQAGLPDQYYLRIGGQAGTGAGELVKLSS